MKRLAFGVILVTVLLPGGTLHAAEDRNLLAGFDIGRDGRPIILPITIGGQEHPFVFDTGTEGIVLDVSLKPHLGKPLESTELPTAGPAVVLVERFEPPPARLGAIDLSSEGPVWCVDLTAIKRTLGQDVRGIIGLGILGAYVLQIDFDQGRFLVFRALPETAARLGERIELVEGPNSTPFIPATIAGRRGLFLLDTGDLGGGALPAKAFDELVQAGLLSVTGLDHCTTAAGTSKIRSGQVRSLAVGPYEQKELSFKEGPMPRIGLDYWSRFRMTLDLPNRRAFLAKGAAYDRPVSRVDAGVVIRRVGGQLVVSDIEEGKPACKAGLKVGDVVLAIQGRPAETYELFDLHRRILREEGKRIEINIRRGDETIPVSLTLTSQPTSSTSTAPASRP